MASNSRQKNGRRTIQFVAGDGRRRSIRLGKMSQRMAESVKHRVELLNCATVSAQAVDVDTALWVTSVDDSLADKLARAGLIEPWKRATTTLDQFLTDYVTRRIDVEPSTQEVWRINLRSLNAHFGQDCDIRSVHVGDAEGYKLHLIGEDLGSVNEPVLGRPGRII